jgi:hypothetical protein
MAINFYTFMVETHSISTTRNAWVGDLVCLCVMEDMSYIKQWMVEGATDVLPSFWIDSNESLK